MKTGSILLALFVFAAATEAVGQSEDQAHNDWFSTDCAADIAEGEDLGITEIPEAFRGIPHGCGWPARFA